METTITMAHGSGGSATDELIKEIFAKEFSNDYLNGMGDSTVVPGNGKIAITTDSFVVTPMEFPGGDIGRLAVCGTVNDCLCSGSEPAYLTCGFILETGAEIAQLRRIVHSMAETAKEAGVQIVAGDTKVVEGTGNIYINTTGVGFLKETEYIPDGAKEGDVILVSGTLGDHHAAILSQRMGIENEIASDCAPLGEIVRAIRPYKVRTLRDATRGGLATVLKELSVRSGTNFVLEEEKLPVSPAVRDFASILGLDPLYMGNEGKLVIIAAPEDADAVLAAVKSAKYGENAAVIGTVQRNAEDESGHLYIKTDIGGLRELDVLMGEGLPRIC